MDENTEHLSENERQGFAEIERFKTRARHFWSLAEETRAKAPRVPPEWHPQYQRLIDRAENLRGRIEGTTTAIDTAYRHGQRVYGLDKSGLQNLGILPLVAWPVIAASSAAIAYFANDAITFNQKVDELERLQEMGYTRDEALQILEKPTGGQAAGGWIMRVWSHPIGKTAIVGGVGYGLYKMWKNRGKG